MFVPQVRVVLVDTLGSGPVNIFPHLLTPLRDATAFLAAVTVFAPTFILLLLVLIIVLYLLTNKCLVTHAKELHRGNVDYVVVVIIILLPFLLLQVVPIAVVIVIVTISFVVFLWFLV